MTINFTINNSFSSISTKSDCKPLGNSLIQAGNNKLTNLSEISSNNYSPVPESKELEGEDYNNLEYVIETGEAAQEDSFIKGNSIFTFFKLPDGKIYTRIRDLETGRVQYFPNLDTFSYNQAVKPQSGTLYEGVV